MPTYRAGTVTLTSGSKTVTGSGTKWADAINGVSAGMMFIGPDGKVNIIAGVASNTSLTLEDNYTGTSGAGQTYKIVTTYEGDISQFSARFTALLARFEGNSDVLYTWLTSTAATMTWTKADGSTETVTTLTGVSNKLGSAVLLTGEQTIRGVKTFNDSINVGRNAQAGIDLGRNDGTASMPFIDFNSTGGSEDYSSRIIANNGTKGVLGSGELNVLASEIKLRGANLIPEGRYGLGGQGALLVTGTNALDQLRNLPSGFYRCQPQTPGMPVENQFWVIVNCVWDANTRRVTAMCANVGNGTWFCNVTKDSYTAWVRQWDSTNTPMPLATSNGGSGKTTGAFANGPNYQGARAIADFLAEIKAYRNNSAGSVSISDEIGSWHTYFNVFHRSGVGDGNSYAFMITDRAMTANSYAEVGIRKLTPAGWRGFTKLLHGENTTTDANGFLKSASPILRLANSPDGMPENWLNEFELAGCGAVNNEATGVDAERKDTGIYLIAGSLGLAAEGWTIELPQDANGNRLCFVETETAENGDITVRVSRRKFDIETGNVVAGAAMDIPAGRWIDLRLSMPAPREPDYSETETSRDSQ
ncbi:hypothetical protein VSX61_19410 [Brenneria populi subsp. brevivirga]|uniref:phage tail fiber protein n=1 Tax=Brenneria populi TaxID=1505588 RepID=UPI002E1717F9|nr:hypothetical protein [Brenneria populi subsp. brevivirga]